MLRDLPTANDENGFFRGCALGQRFFCAIWRSLLRRMGSEYSIHPLIQPCRFVSPPQRRVLPRFIDQQNFHPARCPPFGYDHKWHCWLALLFISPITRCSGHNLRSQRALSEVGLLWMTPIPANIGNGSGWHQIEHQESHVILSFVIFRTVGNIYDRFSTHCTHD